MRSPIGNPTVCKFTRGQIGWWDSDRDSVPDVLDTCPETVLYAYSPDPCSTFTPTYAGTCWVVPLPNLNPRGGERSDVTLNLVARVEHRVDGGLWEDAVPDDGAWDSQGEAYCFTTAPLSDGLHVIEARALNTVGNYDTSLAVDTLAISRSGIVGTREVGLFVMIGPNPHGPRVEVRYGVPGVPRSRVPVAMGIYDIRGRKVRELFRGYHEPGIYEIYWDGTTPDGQVASSGLYFLRLVAGEMSVTRKLVLAR
jgi:hypothetical protein